MTPFPIFYYAQPFIPHTVHSKYEVRSGQTLRPELYAPGLAIFSRVFAMRRANGRMVSVWTRSCKV